MYIKTLIMPSRNMTSFGVSELEAQPLMRWVREHLAHHSCTILTDKPYVVKALSGDVLIKCRILRDDKGVHFESRRLSGDIVCYMQMWNRMYAALATREEAGCACV